MFVLLIILMELGVPSTGTALHPVGSHTPYRTRGSEHKMRQPPAAYSKEALGGLPYPVTSRAFKFGPSFSMLRFTKAYLSHTDFILPWIVSEARTPNPTRFTPRCFHGTPSSKIPGALCLVLPDLSVQPEVTTTMRCHVSLGSCLEPCIPLFDRPGCSRVARGRIGRRIQSQEEPAPGGLCLRKEECRFRQCSSYASRPSRPFSALTALRPSRRCPGTATMDAKGRGCRSHLVEACYLLVRLSHLSFVLRG